MDNILDDNLEGNKIDESKANRLTSIIRYVICGFIAATEIKKTYNQFKWFNENHNSNYNEAILFYILGTIALILFIYYNIKQAKKEKISKYFLSDFKSITSIIFIIYSILLIFHYIRLVFFSNSQFNAISFTLISIFISFIIYREIVYLRRKKVSSISDTKLY